MVKVLYMVVAETCSQPKDNERNMVEVVESCRGMAVVEICS